MATYTIEIEEQRTYRSTVTFESDLAEDKVEEILDEVEETNDCMNTDDLIDEIIREGGFKLIGFSEDKDGELDEIEVTSLECEE